MRKAGIGLDEIKSKILALKGSHVKMDVNRGRKKFDSFSGVIKDVYPSVFTVDCSGERQNIQTFSYYDVLCGNVVFK
ncbi:MAG: Veg family protein [Clostridia bacterium]|nr:Veg family protein [Clostridia bacterium]